MAEAQHTADLSSWTHLVLVTHAVAAVGVDLVDAQVPMP